MRMHLLKKGGIERDGNIREAMRAKLQATTPFKHDTIVKPENLYAAESRCIERTEHMIVRT